MSELHTVESLDRQPFKHLVATIGNLPTNFVDSMSYYELLAWLCQYLEKTVIPAIDNNAEALEEVQAKFLELKAYVDDYFKNLDVQEEINNKLDDMAAAGTLEEIIGAYINTNAVLGFDTVDAMKNAENVIDGSFACTYGKNTLNDGEGHFYKIREIVNTDVVDGVNKIALNNYNDLIAVLITNKDIEDINDEIDDINESLADGIVVLLGDSYGVRTPTNWHSWANELASMRGWTHGVDYFNFCTGNSGLTVTDNNYYTNLLSNESAISDKTKVKTFIIAGGYNDNYYFSGSNQDSVYTEKLAELVTYIKANYPNAKIYMGMIGNSNALNGTGIRGVMIDNALNGYSKIAQYANCYYMDNVECVMHRYDYFYSDNTHPNEAGAKMLAYAINKSVYGGGFVPLFDKGSIQVSNAYINVRQVGQNLDISITGSIYPTIPITDTGQLNFTTTYTIPNTTKYIRNVSGTYTFIPFLANAVCSDNTTSYIRGQIFLTSDDGTIKLNLKPTSELVGKTIARLDFKFAPALLPTIYF